MPRKCRALGVPLVCQVTKASVCSVSATETPCLFDRKEDQSCLQCSLSGLLPLVAEAGSNSVTRDDPSEKRGIWDGRACAVRRVVLALLLSESMFSSSPFPFPSTHNTVDFSLLTILLLLVTLLASFETCCSLEIDTVCQQ